MPVHSLHTRTSLTLYYITFSKSRTFSTCTVSTLHSLNTFSTIVLVHYLSRIVHTRILQSAHSTSHTFSIVLHLLTILYYAVLLQ